MRVAVIGGGAAGFFSALAVKDNHPDAEVFILEKSPKLLSKVKVSGGGRCNVTNGNTSIKDLVKAYPRGAKLLKKGFQVFKTNDTMQWFEDRGVSLVIQEDDCVFPVSQNSQTIIDCFLTESRRLGINIMTKAGVDKIVVVDNKLKLIFTKEPSIDNTFDKVIVATGGSPRRQGLDWLEDLGHQIVSPVPSLFTFNMPSESVRDLMGVVVENVLVTIPGTKLKADGPLLITHWGMSGPAILKLSAFGARVLSERNYQFEVLVNWVAEQNQELVSNVLKEITKDHPKKQIVNYRPFGLPVRLWHYLLHKCGLPLDKTWQDLGKKGLNRMVAILTNDQYQASGKTTFKEEFVTCGGVSLESIHPLTMESRVVKNLYFTGEVMDIDGITGGYNFQAAWTTGFIAGKLS